MRSASGRAVHSVASAYDALRGGVAKQVTRVRAPRAASSARGRLRVQPRVAWLSAAGVVAIGVSVAAGAAWRANHASAPAATTVAPINTSPPAGVALPGADIDPMGQAGAPGTALTPTGGATSGVQPSAGVAGSTTPPRPQSANASAAGAPTPGSIEAFAAEQLGQLKSALQMGDVGEVERVVGGGTISVNDLRLLMEAVTGSRGPIVSVRFSYPPSEAAPQGMIEISVKAGDSVILIPTLYTVKYERNGRSWRMVSLEKRGG